MRPAASTACPAHAPGVPRLASASNPSLVAQCLGGRATRLGVKRAWAAPRVCQASLAASRSPLRQARRWCHWCCALLMQVWEGWAGQQRKLRDSCLDSAAAGRTARSVGAACARALRVTHANVCVC